MSGKAKAVPEGFRTITPHMIVRDGVAAIEFYKKAFGAEEMVRMPGPGGQGVMHAELKIGDSMVMLAGEFPGGCGASPTTLNGTCVTMHLYVENVDAAFKRAAEAGAAVMMPVTEMFWGDRYCMLKDPFGHAWSIATHVKDLTPDECRKAADAFFSKMGGGGCGASGG